jgi:uncharacterized protein YqiB (DUF1249 family)
MAQENVTVSIYESCVPPFVRVAMERLYQHMYASLTQLEVSGRLDGNTSTYVVEKDGEVTVILLFQRERNSVRVLNEQIVIPEEEVERFSRHIFARLKSVNRISFPVIQVDIRRLPFPHQQCHSTQDIVLTLPATVDEYRARLGKATRSYVNRYLNKLRRDHPSVSFNVYSKENVEEKQLHDIIDLNWARMAGRYKSSYIDDAEAERIRTLVKSHGFVGVLTINGRTCAGTINYRFGNHYFLQVIGHDSQYDSYGIGTLCCYLTICECIKESGAEYHFLWGQYEYKYRLLGVQRDLDHLVIYRSPVRLVLNGGAALQMAASGYHYAVRTWLLNKARRQDNSSLASWLAFHLVNGARDLKRSFSRVLTARHGVARASAAKRLGS